MLPAAIAERDLRQHFHLSEADRAFVATFRGAASRLGVALHLGLVRYLGYLPDEWVGNLPVELRAFVAGQRADGALVDLAGYGSREAMRTAHLQAALKFTGQVNPEYLTRHWEELVRIAGSLKRGYVTTSLFIRKLQTYPRQHQLTYGLQEYGRLVKTIFILRYLLHQPLRRKINTQLNKGEQLPALRSWLWFGGDGVLRRKQEEAQ